MIDPLVFKTSRELARAKLSREEAANSFGYWIDIENKWENYQKPSELIDFITIHRTHAIRLPEFIEDLGFLNQDERDLVQRYVEIYSDVSRLLATTGNHGDLRHDIVESLITWRVIKCFKQGPINILDFGAGAARYGVIAHLDNQENRYTALDATLAAYTLQNLVLSYLDLSSSCPSFFEYLDYEVLGRAMPDVEQISCNKRVHLPTWVAKDYLKPKWQDVIILSHVHGELSAEDFGRLLEFVDLSLADEGVVVVRSELTWGDVRDYWNTVDLHGIELLIELRNIGLVPVQSENLGGYLTTVFARRDSSHVMKEVETFEIESSKELTLYAAEQYLKKHLKKVIAANRETLILGDDNPLYQKFKGIELANLNHFNALPEEAIDQLSLYSRALAQAEVVVVYSESCRSYAKCLKLKEGIEAITEQKFEIMRAYPFYGVVIFSQSFLSDIEPSFLTPIYDNVQLAGEGNFNVF